jgi:hypothetical protein
MIVSSEVLVFVGATIGKETEASKPMIGRKGVCHSGR